MRIRVNGRTLSQEIGNSVTLFGVVSKISGNQTGLEVTTTDHVKVNVALPEPFIGEIGDSVEVHGSARSKTTVSAESCVRFSPEEMDEFESEEFNDFLLLLKYKLGNHDGLKKAFGIA